VPGLRELHPGLSQRSDYCKRIVIFSIGPVKKAVRRKGFGLKKAMEERFIFRRFFLAKPRFSLEYWGREIQEPFLTYPFS